MSEIHPQVQKARALQPLLEQEAPEINRAREVPPVVVNALKDGSFFRMLQPKWLGGLELKPTVFSQVTEAIAAADASVAWIVCQGNGCAMTAAYLDRPEAEAMFAPHDGILAWGPPGAPFEAEPVEGGYRVSGTWRFASGSQNATWLGAHMKVQGRKEVRTMLFPKTSAVMTDIWHTLGLRGTASNQYTITDLFVPERFSCRRDNIADLRYDAPLYHFTSNQLYSAGFAGVALGIARGVIDAFLALPANKTSRGAARPMRENNVVQSQLAQCEARWHSARAFLHKTFDDVWDHVVTHGEMTDMQRAMLRLCATWAINQAKETVNVLYHAAGSLAVFEDQPFERRLRDMQTVAQQSQGRQLHYESVGQIMFGMPAENQF